MNKKQLAVILSRLKGFDKPDVRLEQYQTDSEIAAETLWDAYMHGNINGKKVADLGCGAGIFGIGAAILGAAEVFMVDIDEKAISLARQNKALAEGILGDKLIIEIINADILSFRKKVDTVVQNPPFGVQKSHTDKAFLLKAMETADVIYSMHKAESKAFIERFSAEHGFKVSAVKLFKFPLRRTLLFHRRKVYYFDAGVWRIERFKR